MKVRTSLFLLLLLILAAPATAWLTRYIPHAGEGQPIFESKCRPGETLAGTFSTVSRQPAPTPPPPAAINCAGYAGFVPSRDGSVCVPAGHPLASR